MEDYIITFINGYLSILTFKGKYPFPSYNGKLEKHPPYPPQKESDGRIRAFCFIGQQVLHLFRGTLHHHPIVGVGRFHLLETQLAHSTAHFLRTEPQRRASEPVDYLTGSDIDAPFQPHRLSVVGQNQLVLGPGHFKLLHMPPQLLYFLIGKPA